MSILIINSAEPEEKSFVDPIMKKFKTIVQETSNHRLEPEVHEWREFLGITHLPSYHAVVISASPQGNNNNFEERIRAFEWLQNARMPVLGICAGHQFIGIIFGGRLLRNMEPEKGITSVRLQSWDPVFRGYENEIAVMQQHEDSITLPEKFNLLARSDRCRVQAMKHKDLPFYGVQWHAEISTPGIFLNLVTIADMNE